MHAVVVDDEPLVARFLAHAAEERGFRASVATTATRFQQLYRERGADLILLDLCLPQMDGVELLRFLASQGSRALIWIVSGADRRVVDAACRLGTALGLRVGGTMSKPVPREKLLKTFAKAERLLLSNPSSAEAAGLRPASLVR